MTVRVLANLCWVVPGAVGGSEEYTTRLLAAVAAGPADENVEVTVAAMAGVAESHPELDSLRWSRIPLSSRWRAVRLLAESTWLARESRHHDLVHHFGGRIPAVRGRPAVVTVHDIQPLDRPELFTPVKRAYLARALPRSVAAARLVVTPSAWVAERVVERLALPEDRVRVVPSTFADDPADPGGASGPGRVLDELGLGDEAGPVIVYPAVSHPHKDHATLIAAFARLSQANRAARLVLTGGRGRSHAAVARLVEATPGVVHVGRVAPDALTRLVERADVLAFPSRYEGFGLPVLEAMRAGTPVVAADATALREVVGGGGVLVEPGDVSAWADALAQVIDHGLDDATAAAARGRVEHYSPVNARRRLLAAWESASTR